MSDHQFNPQTHGSAYCGECRERFDAPAHGWIEPPNSVRSTRRDLSESVATDLRENMERDIAEERQFRAGEYSDDWPL